ncbi:hypothetical protein LBMAG42_00830 [Deltaproteobacteria bacterium]|nr:hypothetical protein LBMAG42_00830 [Deltaproteobacteria bacterium]
MLWLLIPAFAADPLDLAAYSARYPLEGASGHDWPQVQACLAAWGAHPFGTAEAQRYRTVASSVRVMGFGSDEIVDDVATSYPQIVVIRPNVSVMTRTTWSLLNPNGWYCFDTSVTVAAKGVVNLGCGARLADSHGSVEVLGGTERRGGVQVLGKVEVHVPESCPAATP